MMEKKLPAGWAWKRLGDLITYKKGRKPDILLEQKDEGDLPYLTAGYFRTGTPKNFVPLDYHSSCVRCDLNDIVLIWDGSNAGDVFKGLTGVLASTMIKIEPKVQQFLPNFAFLFLKTQFQTLKSRTTGSSIPHISKSVFENLKIPLPSLEQRRIVAILAKADETRRLRVQADELTNQLLQSVFLEMFGDPAKNPKRWEIYKLQDVSEIRSGVTKGRKLAGKPVVSVPYLRVANVQDGYLDLNEIKTIEVLLSDVDKYALLEGDVLLTEGGDPDKLGRGAVLHDEIPNCKEYLVPEFLSMLIGSAYGKMYFLKSAKQTTGIATINSTQLKKFPVLVPPTGLQKKFAHIVEKVEAMRQNQKQSRQEIDNLFNALMQKAFKGELVA
jgi:type I restriction enzyme S subunit